MDPKTALSRTEWSRRRSSRNLALRNLRRERMSRETGSLMHSKQDPKSDLICCVRSEGLCRSIGAKHHRRNKQCWNFPSMCLHCKQARALLGTEASGQGIVPSVPKVEPKTESIPQIITPRLLNQLINELSVDANGKSRTARKPLKASTFVPGGSEEDIKQCCTTGVLESKVSWRSNRLMDKLSRGRIVCSTELGDDEPPHWESYTPLTPDLSEINDFERRKIRSAAPSPESACRRTDRTPSKVLPESGIHRATRDPRLSLQFVLET